MPNPHTLTDQLLAVVPDHNVASTGNGGSVDTLGYQRAMIVVTTTTAAASSANFVIQDSSDGISFAPIAGVSIPSVGASVNGNVQTISVACKNHRRFLRIAYTLVGTVGVDSTYLLAAGDMLPVTQSNPELYVP